jgi:hypothetical protein
MGQKSETPRTDAFRIALDDSRTDWTNAVWKSWFIQMAEHAEQLEKELRTKERETLERAWCPTCSARNAQPSPELLEDIRKASPAVQALFGLIPQDAQRGKS